MFCSRTEPRCSGPEQYQKRFRYDHYYEKPRWRCWFGSSQPSRWQWMFGGRNNTNIFWIYCGASGTTSSWVKHSTCYMRPIVTVWTDVTRSMVCMSVCVPCVGHTDVLQKQLRTDRDANWDSTQVGPGYVLDWDQDQMNPFIAASCSHLCASVTKQCNLVSA